MLCSRSHPDVAEGRVVPVGSVAHQRDDAAREAVFVQLAGQPQSAVDVGAGRRPGADTDPVGENCMAATDAASGTPIMRSTTRGRNDGSTRGRPMPSIREPGPRGPRPHRPAGRLSPPGPRPPTAWRGRGTQVAADGGARAAGTRADDDPGRHGVWLGRQLVEDRFGDVVVAAPVGGPLGVGELVEVVPTEFVGEPSGRCRTPRPAESTNSHRPPSRSISATLPGTRRPGDHGHEGEPDEAREVRLADRGRPAGGLHHGAAAIDVAVADGVKEQ